MFFAERAGNFCLAIHDQTENIRVKLALSFMKQKSRVECSKDKGKFSEIKNRVCFVTPVYSIPTILLL